MTSSWTSSANRGQPCPIMLTVRGRLATPRPISATSSRSRVRRIPRAPFSPCACSLRPAKMRFSRTSIDHAIAVRRVTVAGVGNAAKFQPADDEIRFSVRFEALQRDAAGNVHQRGVCTLPGGRTAVAHGERRERSVDTGRRRPRVRRAAFRSVLPRLDRLIAHEGSQSAAARQRALHRRRVRHAPRARPREGLVVRRDRRDRPHPATARPHRTSTRTHRLDRTPRADQRTAQQSRAVGGQTTYATCGISRRRSRSPRRCSRCSCSG